MTIRRIVAALAAVCLLPMSIAHAADAADAGRVLPPICTAGSMAGMGSMKPNAIGGMGDMDKAHQDLARGMDAMHDNMMAGMMASDIDVAFVCGMLPHHQGAIDMARAELAHGKDPFARKLATEIIAAQEKEIAQMLDWLKARSK